MRIVIMRRIEERNDYERNSNSNQGESKSMNSFVQRREMRTTNVIEIYDEEAQFAKFDKKNLDE